MPPEVVAQVVAKTDGVPLFVEELTKMVLESGLLRETEGIYELTGPLPPLAIPATLQDALMARLDRLAAVKGLAQLGATLGREFSYALLQAVSPWDEATLQHGLHQLVEAEFLYQQGLPPQATYLFKHALIQDTAYQALLRSTRQQYHQRIAQVLEARFPETGETQPELLAHHYTEAGLAEQAIPYWQRAGERAMAGSANLEAINHFGKALEVLKALPDTPERTSQEIELQTALGPAFMAAKGFGAPEVATAYARARELCHQVGETPQLFTVLRGLWEFYELRADVHTGRELAEEILSLAQRTQDRTLLVVAHDVMGDTSLWLGEFSAARSHTEQSLALYDPREHRSLAFLYGGYDPAMACRSFGGHALWYLGYPDQALQWSHAALAQAQELSQPPSLVFALSHAGILHQLRGEAHATQERAERAVTLATEQGFTFWLAHATIPLGWALVEQGHGEEEIRRMLQGLAGYRATGGDLESPLWLALTAEAYTKVGQPEKGLPVVVEGLALVEQTGVRFHEAELYRLKGELLLKQAVPSEQEAEICFHQALDIARRQQAKSLELRAAMSLSRLWQRQGKHAEARQLLAPIYGWFTEGFDTADLQEARTLLSVLSINELRTRPWHTTP